MTVTLFVTFGGTDQDITFIVGFKGESLDPPQLAFVNAKVKLGSEFHRGRGFSSDDWPDIRLADVRGKMILPSSGKEFFTSLGKQNFTCRGNEFFTPVGKQIFT